MLLCLVEQLSIDGNLLELFFSFLISLSILSDHHLFNFFPLLNCHLKIPFLTLQLLVLSLDCLDFWVDLLDLAFKQRNSFLSLLSDLLNLLLNGFDLIFIHFAVFLGQSNLHLFLHFQHLNLFYHRVEFIYQLIFLLEVYCLFSYAYLASLYFLHDFDLAFRICYDLKVFLLNLWSANQQSMIQFRNWFLIV